MKIVGTCLGLLCLAAAVAAQSSGAPSVAGALLQGPSGRWETLADHHRGDWLVVAWSGVGCPISNKYAARLTRFAERYAGRGVRFVGVNSNPQDDRATITREAKELGLGFPVLADVDQQLLRILDVKTTTEVIVIDRAWTERFRGPVDDQFAVGGGKPAPTKNHLADALEALLAGEAPPLVRSAAPGCVITRRTPKASDGEVDWARHIAPIVRERCESCHRPGQVGPFALQTYDQASGWAAMIGEVVEEERMPPWNADDAFDGHFANERRLTDGEKRLFARWIAAGTPRGDAKLEPPAKRWEEGWRIGKPDAVFSPDTLLEMRDGRGLRWKKTPLPEKGYRVPREGVLDYVWFEVKTDFDEDRWIEAMEARPGAPDVVHHILVFVDDPKWTREERIRDLRFNAGGSRSYFCVAVPGDTPSRFPPGYAKRLPKGATLRFQLHYTPNGKERWDRSSVAFRFARNPVKKEVRTYAVRQRRFRIPPGAESHEVSARLRLRESVDVLGYYPHMHTRGKDFTYSAVYPDGTRKRLLAVDFDFNWQESYVLKKPLSLPRGTVLECVGHFDNSAANPNNPDPTRTVRWGDQTFDEMFIGFYDYVIRQEEQGR